MLYNHYLCGELKHNSMKLTEHFTLEEFVRSSTATKYKIDNTPGEKEIKRLRALCENVLEPLRVAYGAPINVSSGYRCPELNSHPEVKGSATSDHVHGMAADIQVYKRTKDGVLRKDPHGNPIKDKDGNKRLFELCVSLGLHFKQLINENDFSWVHVSYQAESTKHEIKKMNQ